MNWVRFLLRRMLSITLSLFIVTALVFLIMEVIPGDLARTILGQFVTEEQLQILREQLGLNRPPLERYGAWVSGMLVGDFGHSVSLTTPIGPLLLRRGINSLTLAALATAIGLIIAIVLGFVAGLGRPAWLDQLLSGTAVIVGSLPQFLVAMLLVLLFSFTLGWFPATSRAAADAPLANPSALVLPVATEVLAMTAYILKVTRVSVVRV